MRERVEEAGVRFGEGDHVCDARSSPETSRPGRQERQVSTEQQSDR